MPHQYGATNREALLKITRSRSFRALTFNFNTHRITAVYGSFGVVLMSWKVDFHVVRAALQNSVCQKKSNEFRRNGFFVCFIDAVDTATTPSTPQPPHRAPNIQTSSSQQQTSLQYPNLRVI